MATAKCTTSPRDVDAPISSQSSEEIDSRQLKIRDFRPYKRLLEGNEPGSRPSLHLQGRWLEKAGFPIGANVRVRVTPRRLVVEWWSAMPTARRWAGQARGHPAALADVMRPAACAFAAGLMSVASSVAI